MPPRVSVVIPLYNPGLLFDRCLGSVRRQSYGDLEIVLVDDAGAEQLRSRLEALAVEDPRVRPVIHDTNLGLAASLNDGVRRSTGDFVLLLEQDCEILEADAVARAVEVIAGHPKTVLSGVPVLPLEEMRLPEVAFCLIRDHAAEQHAADHEAASYCELKCDLFPRQAFAVAGFFDEDFRFSGEDQVMSHRLRGAGWTIARSRALRFVLRSGAQTTVRANLRREFTYGRTQAAILLRTRTSARSSGRLPQGRRRLLNRLFAWASGGVLVLTALALLVAGPTPWAMVLLSIPLARMVVVASRVRSLSGARGGHRKSALLAAALSPADDLVYSLALGVGAIAYALTRRA